MSFDERFAWFLLGVVVGWLLSMLKNILNEEMEIKHELDEVAEIMRKRKHDEGGFMRFPVVADILLLAVVLLTVWAALSTSNTNVVLEENQRADNSQDVRIETITACNQRYLFKTIQALNQRTQYSVVTSESNVALQRGLAEFIDILLFQPPKSDSERVVALQQFDKKLEAFVENSDKTRLKAEAFPYPTEAELSNCLGYEINTTVEDEQSE